MKRNRIFIKILKFFLYFILAWILLLGVLQLIVSEKNLTNYLNDNISQYVEGDVKFGKVSLSFFSHFPKFRLEMEDVSITHPSEMFAKAEKEGAQGRLTLLGNGEIVDTLASFDKFSISLNTAALIWGNVRINTAELAKPRIFLHRHADGTANWDIIKLNLDSEENDEAFEMPNITLGKIKMYNRPLIVYTDSKDTVFILARNNRIELNGKVATEKGWSNKLGLEIEDIRIGGRVKQDSLHFGLNYLSMSKVDEKIELKATSKTSLATKVFGRMTVPIELIGEARLHDTKNLDIEIDELICTIAEVPFHMKGRFKSHKDSLEVKAAMYANEIDINEILKKYGKNIHEEASEIETNIKLDFSGEIDGAYVYATETLPHFKFNLSIPESEISHKELAQKLDLRFKLNLENDKEGKINANIPEMIAYGSGTSFNASGKANDILGNDPLFTIKLDAHSHLDSLMWLVPHELPVILKGDIQIRLDGRAKLSQLDTYNFSGARLNGDINSKHFEVKSDSLGIDSMVDKLAINLKTIKNPYTSADKRDNQLLEINASVDSTVISYKDSLKLTGIRLYLRAQNSTTNRDIANKTRVVPMGGRIEADGLIINYLDALRIVLGSTSNKIMISPSKTDANLANITLKSITDRIFYRDIDNRVMASQAEIDISADKLSHLESNTLTELYKNWDVSGQFNLNRASIITKHLPLRNRVREFSGSFNNDNITLEKLHLQSGDSDLEIKGRLYDLKDAINNKDKIRLKLDVFAPRLYADDLLAAYMSGQNTTFTGDVSLSDAEFQKAVVIDSINHTQLPSYILIPDNIEGDIKIDAYNVRYLTLQVDSLNSNIKIKDKCVQLTDFVSKSNMGEMYLDGFYATRSKEDIKAGFNLNLNNITAHDAIELLPAIDTLMPIIKTFDGLINCGISATTEIDTTMNIIIPSITGAMRLSGTNLTIKDNPEFRKIAKSLMFKDKKFAKVDALKIDGIITRGIVNIFPFRLVVDRYNLAISGRQNLDLSYFYHMSVLKSPLPFRIGLDISGKDFDSMETKITKAKYRTVRPELYDPVMVSIEENLRTSIKDVFNTGVDEVINQNESITGM